MDSYLPRALRDAAPRAQRKTSTKGPEGRWTIRVGDREVAVAEVTETRLVLAEPCDLGRARADLYRGQTHIAQCLIQRAEDDGEAVHYEFKWRSPVLHQPAPDYATGGERPVALLTRRAG